MHVLFYVWKDELHYLSDDNPIIIDNVTLPDGLSIASEAVSQPTDSDRLNFEPVDNPSTKSLGEITASFGIVIRDGRPMVSSRDVARVFGKQHKNVLRSVNVSGCSEKFRQINFERAEYIDEKGEKRPEYFMTRDGFTFMVMGYTGYLASQFKEAYIEAFNVMEQALTQR